MWKAPTAPLHRQRHPSTTSSHEPSAGTATGEGLNPSDVAALIDLANGATECPMEIVRLPSLLVAGFDLSRYAVANKAESDLKARANRKTELPEFLETGSVNEFTYLGNKNLHRRLTPTWECCRPSRLRSPAFSLRLISDDLNTSMSGSCWVFDLLSPL